MENLYETLAALSAWCRRQSGTVLWTLMQTHDNGRDGFQLLVMDHAAGCSVMFALNASTLAELAEDIMAELRRRLP